MLKTVFKESWMEKLSPDYLSINWRASLIKHSHAQKAGCAQQLTSHSVLDFFFLSMQEQKHWALKPHVLDSLPVVMFSWWATVSHFVALVLSTVSNSTPTFPTFFLAPLFLSALMLGIWPYPPSPWARLRHPDTFPPPFKELGVCMRTSALSVRL